MLPIITRPILHRMRSMVFGLAVVSAAACDSDRLEPADPGAPASSPERPVASVAFTGIPFGIFELPTSKFGSLYNGAKRTFKPWQALDSLAIIKARGGRVIIKLAGVDTAFQTSTGRFDFTKWKARVDRFRKINIGPYIADGTIFGHYMIDEPGSAQNWGGVQIPPSTIEAMAKYSKSIWPNLPTLVREESTYLASWTGTYVYLDAAWAQYVYRKGPVGDFLTRNVADAKKKGLALAVGLNVRKGGPNGVPMTASQVSTWGSTLLSSSYPCTFLSWQYNPTYLSTQAMKDAMALLRSKAQNRATKSCRGT